MSTDTISSQLLQKFRNQEYREAFVDAHVSDTIASQVFALRKKERWTQTKLAEKCGMAQERISLLENPDYGDVNISTLKRLASAFGVALDVKFIPFSILLTSLDELSLRPMAVPSFKEEEQQLENLIDEFQANLAKRFQQQGQSAQEPPLDLEDASDVQVQERASMDGGQADPQRQGRSTPISTGRRPSDVVRSVARRPAQRAVAQGR